VVLAVGRAPFDHRAFKGHRPQHAQDELHGRAGFERLVREQAVVPDRDAKPGRDVHPHHDPQVDPVEGHAPEHDDSGEHARGRNQHRHQGKDTGSRGGAWEIDGAAMVHACSIRDSGCSNEAELYAGTARPARGTGRIRYK